jgi:hypothetical protein
MQILTDRDRRLGPHHAAVPVTAPRQRDQRLVRGFAHPLDAATEPFARQKELGNIERFSLQSKEILHDRAVGPDQEFFRPQPRGKSKFDVIVTWRLPREFLAKRINTSI